MNLLKDLTELIKAEVISQETADDIRKYYERKRDASSNRLFVVFGILGAILVGLGIILIIAHNWDELSRNVKTVFSFIPLLLGQLFCGYVLLKKPDNTAWRESTSAFLFFAVGASIALIGQVYHIPGSTATFLQTWMLLCLPLVYLMRSSITSLLFICGITYYATQQGYWSRFSPDSYVYWLMLVSVLPHYIQLCKKKAESNFTLFHHWIVPLSIIISLGTLANKTGEFLTIAYFSLFGLFYLLGSFDYFSQQKLRNNPYRILGSLGSLVMLLVLSFGGFWEELRKETYLFEEIILSAELYVAAILSVSAALIFYSQHKNKALREIRPLAPIFILYLLTFVVGMFSTVAVVLINLYILTIGVLTVLDGIKQDHLGILNFGLMIITALVICRFFDSNISFVLRGVLFLIVGTGFFVTNYRMLKKRKTNAE